MATTIFESIKDSLIHLFKGLYPAFDITCEELPRTRENGGTPAVEDYIFLDIIPAGNETRGPHQTDRRVLVDVALHAKPETNGVYLQMIQEVDAALRPVFRFEDGGEARAVTLPDVSFRIVDKVLHCTFTLAFTDSGPEPESPPLMEELSANINERT